MTVSVGSASWYLVARMKLVWALVILVFVSACTPHGEKAGHLSVNDSQRIFGGEEVEVQAGVETSVVMITLDDDMGQSFICTGTFITDRLVLTASHCVNEDPNRMRLLYGAAPYSGLPFKVIEASRVHLFQGIVEDGSKEGTAKRHDLAIVEFNGGLPEGATVVDLPNSANLRWSRQSMNLPQQKTTARIEFDIMGSPSKLNFLALGYGRVHGEDVNGSDVGGAGVLRRVNLDADDFRMDAPAFSVWQTLGERGVCFGDSGGPAIVEMKDLFGKPTRQLIVGVASGVMAAPGADEYATGYDACKQRSIYMNVLRYMDWIDRVMKKVLVLSAGQE